jgi:uncharacterized membrane protein YfbV (UPF0208 family)
MNQIDWIAVLERAGTPLIILATFTYLAMKGIKWLGTNVLLNLHERHITYLDKTESHLQKTEETQERILQELQRLKQGQEEQKEMLETIIDILEEVTEEQEESE